MPYRFIPFVNNEIYHIYNRSIAHQPIFLKQQEYLRFLEIIFYYSYRDTKLRYSHYNRLSVDQKAEIKNQLRLKGKKLVNIFAYTIMLNHFHFLLQQQIDNGIKLFLSNLQNSYAKYFNKKYKRSGALFQSMFKGVRIETDEQFLHVSRYLHLNPLTSFVIKNAQELEKYPWTSFAYYLGKINSDVINPEMLMGFFPSKEKLKKYTMDQVEYQQKLEEIKHLLLE